MSNIKYREDQTPISKYRKGKMAVQAVPGSGKTFIITNLVTDLLEETNDKKTKILILTYMNSAVSNFKSRIKKRLEEKNLDLNNNYEVMTIHSLAVKIIKEKPEIVMLSEEFNIIDELQRNIIIRSCIDNFKINHRTQVYNSFLKPHKDDSQKQNFYERWDKDFYGLVINAISELKYNNISSDKLTLMLNEESDDLIKIIAPIYKNYEMSLKKQGFIDFDDVLILAHRMLIVDEDLRKKMQNKYQYIFEDECQDSNEIQGKIIKILSKEKNNLVRVGDINQSITGTFSSSNPKFFKDFINKADYYYKMDMSNRSSKDIINLTNTFVEYVCHKMSQEDCKKALSDIKIRTVSSGEGYKENPNPSKYQINTKWYKGSWKDEISETIRFVKGIKNKYPNKSIAILVPTNENINEIAVEMEKSNLEFEALGPISNKKRSVLNKLSYIINFLDNCDDIEILIDLLDKVFIKEKNQEIKRDFYNILRNYNTEELIYENNELVIDTQSVLYKSYKKGVNIIARILEYSTIRKDLLVIFIAEELELTKEEHAIIQYIAFYVKQIININKNITLSDIYMIISDRKNKVFNTIVEVVYEINGYEPEEGSITICNYHKSKGLEWDCVFVLGLTQFNFPDNINQKFMSGDKWYLKDKYKNPNVVIKKEIMNLTNKTNHTNYFYENKIEIINEKIRLLYVIITRAKEMLILSGCDYNSEMDKEKDRYKQEPSTYYKELKKHIDINRNKQEKGVK